MKNGFRYRTTGSMLYHAIVVFLFFSGRDNSIHGHIFYRSLGTLYKYSN